MLMGKKMTKSDILKVVNEINAAGYIIPSLIAVVKENEKYKLKIINISPNDLSTSVKEITDKIVQNEIIDSELDVKPISEIATNINAYYEIQQDDTYRVFSLKLDEEEFEKKDTSFVIGFFLVLEQGSNSIWFYQHKNLSTEIKNKIVLFEKDSVFHAEKKNLFKIEQKCDFFIINDSIFTKSIKLLQREFGFTSFIYKQAKDMVSLLDSFGLVSDITKLSSTLDAEISENIKITISKKLMKINFLKFESIGKDEIYERIKSYKDYYFLFKTKFDDSTKTIKITSKADVNNILKVLSNTLLYSPLTKETIDTTK